MCDVYEERWDSAKHKFVSRRLPGTGWCTCALEDQLHPCRQSFLCLHEQVPACVLTENQVFAR